MAKLYPTVAVDCLIDQLEVNFGNTPFKFDFRSYAISEIDKTFESINKVEIERQATLELIMSYLYINGNYATLTSLEA